jgi:hypothetical protein
MRRATLVQALLALSLLVAMVGPAVPEATAQAGNKALIINVYGQYTTPVPGALVRVVPSKPIPGKNVLAEATTNEQGIAEFNNAKGNSIPMALIVQGGGLRLLISHPAHQDKDERLLADELTYTTQPKEVDAFITPKPPEAQSFVFKGVEIDPFYAKNTAFAVTDRQYSFTNASNGEKIVLIATSAPPATITTSTEFTVSVEAKIENASLDWALELCWASKPDESPICGSTAPGSLFFGRNGETKQITPAAKADFRVRVPIKFAGNQPALVFRVMHGLYVETSTAEWMRWTFVQK